MSLKKILDKHIMRLSSIFFFSAHSDNKQKSFFPKKKIGVLLFETIKNLIF